MCFEVVHPEARRRCPRVPGAERKSPAHGARHAFTALHPDATARRNPDRVEGRDCHSSVRGLKAPVDVGAFVQHWILRLTLSVAGDAASLQRAPGSQNNKPQPE